MTGIQASSAIDGSNTGDVEFQQAGHASRDADIAEQIIKYILRQFLVFVQEGCKLGEEGIWPVDRVEKAALEFLRRATIDAVSEKGRVLGKRWISHLSGDLTSEICRQFEKSFEWQQYQEMLLLVRVDHECRQP